MPESRPGRVHGGVGPAPVAAPHLHHPVLDIACAAHCASGIAHALDRPGEAGQAARFLDLWRAAFDPATGMMRPGRYYEAAHTHYSFRRSGAVRAEAGPVLRLRRSAGAAATRAAVGRGARPRHGTRPLRRGEQRGDAGDPVCLSLRRPPGRTPRSCAPSCATTSPTAPADCPATTAPARCPCLPPDVGQLRGLFRTP